MLTRSLWFHYISFCICLFCGCRFSLVYIRVLWLILFFYSVCCICSTFAAYVDCCFDFVCQMHSSSNEQSLICAAILISIFWIPFCSQWNQRNKNFVSRTQQRKKMRSHIKYMNYAQSQTPTYIKTQHCTTHYI